MPDNSGTKYTVLKYIETSYGILTPGQILVVDESDDDIEYLLREHYIELLDG